MVIIILNSTSTVVDSTVIPSVLSLLRCVTHAAQHQAKVCFAQLVTGLFLSLPIWFVYPPTWCVAEARV